MLKLMKLIIPLIIFNFLSDNVQSKARLFSCYYDTGIKEINDTKVNEEFKNKSFGMVYIPEKEWFWWHPPNVIQVTEEEWKRERNYKFNLVDNVLIVSTYTNLKNNELNLESKQKGRPKEIIATQTYELDTKLNITWTSYKVLTFNYYEKRIKLTRTGQCTY